ncbi:MAG TPA: hypothetical protein PKY25_00590 [Bacilli bacterium]|nr:hypothetical protein [Bacilli bacterium]
MNETNINISLYFIKNQYEKCFFEKHYSRVNPVKITSMTDPSVTFIGSTVSVFKPYILNEDIDPKGMYLLQKSIRTRGFKKLLIPEYSEWGSFFTCMGAILPYSDQNLEKLVYDIFDYLVLYLNIDYQDIVIRVNNEDKDLVESLKNIDSKILREYNTKDEKYYKHRYGLDYLNIYGRNFNIALRDKNDNQFKDIGNIIVMESPNKKYAVEVGIGDSSIVLRTFGKKSSIECSHFGGIFDITNAEELKFADCLIVVSNLVYEDVKRIIEPRYPRYYFGKYCKALVSWQKELKISNIELLKYIREYIYLEYNQELEKEDNKILQYINKSSKSVHSFKQTQN